MLLPTIEAVLKEEKKDSSLTERSAEKIDRVWIVGEKPMSFAKSVSDDITVIPMTNEDDIAERIEKERPNAVLWATDPQSKRLAGRVAARLSL